MYWAKFNSNNKLIATCSLDKTIKLWNYSNYENQVSITLNHSFNNINEMHKEPVYSVCFNKDDNRLVSCSRDKSIKVWDV